MGTKFEGATNADLLRFAPEAIGSIIRPGNLSRSTPEPEESLMRLCESIAEIGQSNPVTIRRDNEGRPVQQAIKEATARALRGAVRAGGDRGAGSARPRREAGKRRAAGGCCGRGGAEDDAGRDRRSTDQRRHRPSEPAGGMDRGAGRLRRGRASRSAGRGCRHRGRRDREALRLYGLPTRTGAPGKLRRVRIGAGRREERDSGGAQVVGTRARSRRRPR